MEKTKKTKSHTHIYTPNLPDMEQPVLQETVWPIVSGEAELLPLTAAEKGKVTAEDVRRISRKKGIY